MADKHKVSNRALTEILGEIHKAQNDNIDNTKLYIMGTKRKQDLARTEMGTKFLDNNLNKIKCGGILHWDGKILKTLTHVGQLKERVAILINQNGEDILLGVSTVEV